MAGHLTRRIATGGARRTGRPRHVAIFGTSIIEMMPLDLRQGTKSIRGQPPDERRRISHLVFL
jgi:hypothetical protein